MRYLKNAIEETLARKKMVFLGGPRQVGKTTFAQSFLPSSTDKGYLNYDHIPSKKIILTGEIPSASSLIIYDEIHKFSRWRNLIKGLYDVHKREVQFIVTGSARLDYYRKGGDSLLGRYEYYRLHPFSLTEADCKVDDLLQLSGFPEPLFGGSTKIWRKWQNERIQKVIHEDINSLERIKEINLMDLLIEALSHRIASPLSVNSLREELQVNHNTIVRWLDIFDRMYLTFRLSPYGSPKIRAVKKEQKLYFWDWSFCQEDGAKFENLVASHLLKYCHFMEDTEGHKMELRYLRDTDGREIDFVVLKDRKPLMAVECKIKEKELNPQIKYFKERTSIPLFYQVHLGTKDYGHAETSGRCIPFKRFCQELQIP